MEGDEIFEHRMAGNIPYLMITLTYRSKKFSKPHTWYIQRKSHLGTLLSNEWNSEIKRKQKQKQPEDNAD